MPLEEAALERIAVVAVAKDSKTEAEEDDVRPPCFLELQEG